MNLQTVRTVCKELGVPENRVRRAIRSGQLDVLKLGNRLLIDMDTAREMFAQAEGTINIGELSKAIGMSETGIRRGIREGWIPYERVGWAYLFRLDEVEKAIRKRMAKR